MGYTNVHVPTNQAPQFNLTGVVPGALTSAAFTPAAPPNIHAKGVDGGLVFLRPGLDTSLTPAKLPAPVNRIALNSTTPWQMSTRTTSGGRIIPRAGTDCQWLAETAPYKVNGLLAGQLKTAVTLWLSYLPIQSPAFLLYSHSLSSYVRIYGAGHEVPAYKAALQFFTQMMANQSLSSTWLGLC
ncbi:hypothetical protein FB45DRAFT_863934 [Roridomyces roridus]|nr:hypothetical protein C8R44DRAFT_746066 [Mycena epipterygia]KAJ7639156.1 hypothetical protein FB45DRAFT_863934 [Roridomyces roridus]